jgi:hypothetical protein
MVYERTEVEKYVRWFIASDILYRTLKSLGEKGVRRLDKTATEISSLLRNESEIGDRIEAKIEELPEEEKARTINEGIDEFCKEYLEEGKKLKELIEEKRTERNNYLICRLKEGYKLAEEDYIRVLMDIGFGRREASAMYSHILSVSEKKGGADGNQERTILLKEQKSKKKKK